MTSDKIAKTFAIVIVTVLIVGGVATVNYATRQILKARDSRQWTQTSAYVSDAEIDDSGDTRSYRVRYQYNFGGYRFEGARINFGFGSSCDCKFENIHSGDTTTVFVNPANPSEAVLFPGEDGGIKFLLLFGLAFIGFGVVGLWRIIRGEPVRIEWSVDP